MANSGFQIFSKSCNENFIKNFKGYEYIVSPSGSCVLHIKEHNPIAGSRIFELSEFLIDILKVEALEAIFPYKVGLSIGCHGQRGLHIAQMSELVGENFSKPLQLLKMVKDIEIINLNRTDECCGFGGTFCLFEEAVSVKMGKDRINDHLINGAEYIIGTDISCLMHLEGIIRRNNTTLKVKHISEILNNK